MSRRVDIERNLYAVTWQVARGNIGPCAAAAVLLAATDIGMAFLETPLAFAVLRALILMIVGYAAYRMLLTGGAVHGWRAASTVDGRIPWRFAGIMLIILGPILLLGVVWTAPGSGGPGPAGLAELVLGLAMVVSYAALYILVGTALPEVAERGDVVLRDAVDRGRGHYRQIGRAMVLGPWVFRVGSLLVLLGLALAGVTVDPVHFESGTFRPAGLVPLLAFKATHVFAEVMTAVVLVRAYRRYRTAPEGAVPA